MAGVLREDLGADLAMMARVVQSQLTNAMTAFFQKDQALAGRVSDKDDQVDNLLGLIEDKCFQRIAVEGLESHRARALRGVFRVALNLEKLGDYAVNIAEQAVHLTRLAPRPLPFDLAGPARVALAALDEVITAFTDGSAQKAKHACRCEIELDRQYREALAEAFRRLALPGQDPPFVITNLFVAKFLERIGDSILNIGETTLFILTGERLKLHQYLHLEEMVGRVAAGAPTAPEVDIRQIWGGISGARVGRLSVGSGEALLWKEGAEGKIDEELRSMREWNRIVPGLVPDVKTSYQAEGRESFLGQFLDGALLRDVLLTRRWDEKVRVVKRLLLTVRDVWLSTLAKQSPSVSYVRQILDRLPELYEMHPALQHLRGGEARIFGIAHRSLGELLEVVARVEARLAPPVSVRIHGDFNTNNIVYTARDEGIHFIDVHRSGDGDYVQDVSVLLVSSERTPLEEPRLVAELEELNGLIRSFAAEFAGLVGDDHFDLRLMLARARSLITSGRVVGDPTFARGIYLEGVRLLERVAERAA